MSATATPARSERGAAKRRRILEATLALVGRHGAGAVTHRAVASEAGVPLAATTYYFSSRHELLAQALEHAAQEDVEQLEHDAAGFAAPPLTVESLAQRLSAHIGAWLRGDRPTLIAQYEISLESARRPELAATSRAWTEAYARAIAPSLERLGSTDPERDGWIVFAALCGMVLDELSAPQEDFEDRVLRPGLERLLRGLVGV